MFACTNERCVWPTAIVSPTLSNALELSQVPSRQADYKYRCQEISWSSRKYSDGMYSDSNGKDETTIPLRCVYYTRVEHLSYHWSGLTGYFEFSSNVLRELTTMALSAFANSMCIGIQY